MQERGERTVRGTAMGTVALVAAASSHALAGGPVPGWLGIAVGLVFASLVGTALVARRPSLPRTALVVGLSQGAFHAVFVTLGGPAITVGAGMHTARMAPEAVQRGTAPMGIMSSGRGTAMTDPPMLVAHALAGLITIIVLRRAETAVWRMLRRLARIVLRALCLPRSRPAAEAAGRAPEVRVVGPVASRLVSVAPRRGPPLARPA